MYMFMCSSRPGRLKNTPESMMLHFKRVNKIWSSSPAHYRKKPDKAEMELLAERASCVWHLGQELQKEVPITPEVLREKFYAKYENGDTAIETDVIAALLEKSDNFHIRDIGALCSIMDAHNAAMPTQGGPSSMIELDQDKYALAIKQAKYDIEVFRVFISSQMLR